MEVFDTTIVKRENLDDFSNDNTYLDQFMPYGAEVFETQSIDWFSGLVDDRTMPSTLGSLSDYSNLDPSEERSNGFDLQQRNNHYSIYHETSSSELDHGPDLDNSELEIDVKSFYSQENFYSQGLNTTDALIEFKTENIKTERNADYLMKCSEEDALGLSDRDSESGYDSVAHSPTSETPTTPSRCLIMASCDNEILNQGANEVRSPNEQTDNRRPFFLSDEEKRTLITEGLPIPAGYPLTKSEERALKKVRRKIKNKISAQESRRKKKEYMEHLEKRVEMCSNENRDLRKKLDNMETANRALISQLQKLQSIVASKVSTTLTACMSTQTEEEKSS
ncbi:uncharacterized protein LOC124438282 [Xenia sp. Carnegie-2017]|uniref:uncharacterized protein LOC124438282 n=1 Tax=Xenia sp. Carnegie-2017 TaxID=2897299 RepID=UPI001F03D7B0|nr:uncharacterized protein LOC124438282 [Xenia sp. Carnegie-2017]XP_046844293.1 uncharacterized protein LOC124438282 [Xenia sp. Carnegie-2017]